MESSEDLSHYYFFVLTGIIFAFIEKQIKIKIQIAIKKKEKKIFRKKIFKGRESYKPQNLEDKKKNEEKISSSENQKHRLTHK